MKQRKIVLQMLVILILFILPAAVFAQAYPPPTVEPYPPPTQETVYPTPIVEDRPGIYPEPTLEIFQPPPQDKPLVVVKNCFRFLRREICFYRLKGNISR